MSQDWLDEPLFLSKSVLGGIEKVATYKLGRNTENWEEEIMTFLHEQYPYLQDYNVRIHLNRIDQDSGMGVGQIVLDDKIAIPLIVEEFKLYPLDLFFSGGKLRPLSKETLLGSLQETALGKPVQMGTGEIIDQSLYTDTFPPYVGRYAYASKLRFTEEQLSGAMSELGDNGFAFALSDNPAFRKVAAAYAAAASSERPLEKQAGGFVSLMEIVFRPFERIEKTGAFTVVANGMEKVGGLVYDTVIDLDDTVLEDVKMFRAFDGRSCLHQGDLGGIPVGEQDLEKVALDTNRIKDGDYGFFWMTKKGQVVATTPMRLLYTGTEGGHTFMKVASFTGTKKVYISADYDGLFSKDGIVFMGADWNWEPCSGQIKLANTATANSLCWPQECEEIRAKGGRVYVNGPTLDKLGFARDGESKATALEVLGRMLGEDLAGSLVKKAESLGSVFLKSAGVTATPKRRYSAGDLRPVNLVKEAAFIRPVPKFEFFKFAQEVTDEDAETTVDAVLGLNFINDENIHRFLEESEPLDEAVGILARLLLASRLGLKIEQAPIRTAMFAVDEVARQLEELRNVTFSAEE